jgi:hypothetical protein
MQDYVLFMSTSSHKINGLTYIYIKRQASPYYTLHVSLPDGHHEEKCMNQPDISDVEVQIC